MDHIVVTVNGLARPLPGIAAHTTLLDALRSLGLTGAKEGCAEGECGACAVLWPSPTAMAAPTWTRVNSCLVPIAMVDGHEVVTAEGIAMPDRLHPVQAGAGRGRRLAVRLLHARLRHADVRRVLPSDRAIPAW